LFWFFDAYSANDNVIANTNVKITMKKSDVNFAMLVFLCLVYRYIIAVIGLGGKGLPLNNSIASN